MNILINKKVNQDFVIYLKKYIFKYFIDICDKRKLKLIDEEFKIKSYKILFIAFKLLKITNTTEYYVIYIDKNLTVDGKRLSTLINMITYGNRSVKGYTIVLDIFKSIKKNISYIYDDWKNGGSI
jgi:hypothetical protein